jgi:hypothetical protein
MVKKKQMNSKAIDNIEEWLSEMVLEAVRCGLPKSQVQNIYDVIQKTIPSIRRAQGATKHERHK